MKLRLAALCTAAVATAAGANECAVKTSRDNATISGIVNTYYPVLPRTASNGYSSGESSIPLGPALTCAGCATDPIVVGDQVLLIQYLDGQITSTNDANYGDGSAGPESGRGITNTATSSLGMARYTILRVVGVSGNVITVGNGAGNVGGVDFVFGTATMQARPRGAMIVRIPQYANVTLSGTVTAPPLQNGSVNGGSLQHVGGIVVIDAAGTLDFNGHAIDVSGRGFRGGGGRQYTGTGAAWTATDYVRSSSATVTGAHGSKGEGIAGTPRFVYDTAQAAVIENTGFTSAGTGSVDGYGGAVVGSVGRGAPGNAGGGGTDALPTPALTGNSGNTGGGGGAGFGNGGDGGNFNNSGNGGIGGAGITNSVVGLRNGNSNAGTNAYVLGNWQMATFGGGGGAGSANTAGAAQASGAPGGGIVIIRANAITGSGAVRANGANAGSAPAGDAAGGGGGGGWMIIGAFDQSRVPNPALLLDAKGGNGGSVVDGGNNSGPGGGGGGGAISVTSNLASFVAVSTSGGNAGLAPAGSTSTGASGGSSGDSLRTFGFYQFGVGPSSGLSRSASAGAECVPLVRKSYSPYVALSGTNRTFTIEIVNANDGLVKAPINNINLVDTYPLGVVNAATPNLTNNGNCGSTNPGTATAGDNKFTAVGGDIPGGTTCAWTMTVTATGSGVLTNSIAQDAVTVDIGAVGGAIPSTNETVPTASLTFPASVTASKQSVVIRDPLNADTNPKRIPGATVDYTVTVNNTTQTVLDNNTMVISDAIPSTVKLFVNNLPNVTPAAPYQFTAGASNLTCSNCLGYSTLASPNVNNDADWAYTPVPDADGADVNVKHIRFKTSGSMANGSVISFRYRTIVK